jgi:uncharacterized protein YaaW (UPF0174 family)
VDELRAGLELATDDELQTLTEILFSRKFNPLDYVCVPHPIDVQSRDRQAWIDALEDRFRFLAADGITVLRRKTNQVSYRHVLIQVCRHLKISYGQDYSTAELEAEIFLNLLERAWQRLPHLDRQRIVGELQEALSEAQLVKQISPTIQQDQVGLALKGGGALAVHSVVAPWILQQIARQIAIHTATHQIATQTLARASVGAAAQLQAKIALQTASRGMVVNTARYTAARTTFAFLGPALWAWFFADLGWRTIATNYARIIPVIFTLAQIRLMRAEFF